MPLKPVSVRTVRVHGNPRFSVLVPARLNSGKRRERFFASRQKAEDFCRMVNSGIVEVNYGFEILDVQDRIRVGLLIKKVGGVANLERAADLFLIHNPDETRTIGELATECWGAKKKAGFSPGYLGALSNTFRRFGEAFAKREAQSVTASEIAKWLHSSEWASQTQRGYLKDIRTLYAYALKQHYVTSNPALAVDMPKMSKAAPGILTPDQAERLMRTIERDYPAYVPFVALVLFGGLRTEEAFRCRWEYVKGEVIDLPAGKAKNNKRRLIEFAALADEMKQPRPCTLERWLKLGGDLPPRWRKIKMPEIRRATAIGELGPLLPIPWPDNCLRHSFCSYAVPIAGIAQAALMADHSETILKRHYRELVTRADAERFWRIVPLNDSRLI